MATLLAAYSFDAQDGTDASGNGHTGTVVLNGNASGFDTGHTGHGLGKASGVNAPYMTIPKTGLSPTGAWTIMAWVAPNPSGSAQVIADAVLTGGATIMLLANPGSGLCGAYMNTSAGAGGAWFSGTTVDFTTGWHHVAFVYDNAGTVTAYIDGSVTQSHSFGGTGTVYTGTNPWRINNDSGGNYTGSSVIDDWRFYDSALTLAQITTCMGVPVGTTADPLSGGGSQTLSPTGIASAEAFGTATVTRGPVTLSPSGIASAEAFGTPVLTHGPVTLSPSGIASAEAFGTPVVTPGPVTLSPSGIASAEAFGTPVVTPGPVTLSPSGIASVEAFGTPVVSSGGATIAPTGIASAEAFGTPTIVPGPITLSPSGIASAEAFGTPVVSSGGVTIAPSGIASAEAFGTPSITHGPVTLSPSGIPSAEAFGTPRVGAAPQPRDIDVTASPLQTGWSAGGVAGNPMSGGGVSGSATAALPLATYWTAGAVYI